MYKLGFSLNRQIFTLITVIAAVLFSSNGLAQGAQDSVQMKLAKKGFELFGTVPLLVRFEDRNQQLEMLEKIGNTERLEKFKSEQENFKRRLLRYLENYPAPVGYFYEDQMEAIADTIFDAVFFSDDTPFSMEVVGPILILNPYRIRTSVRDTYVSGVQILFQNGAPIPKPFPVVVANSISVFFRSDPVKLTEILFKRINQSEFKVSQ